MLLVLFLRAIIKNAAFVSFFLLLCRHSQATFVSDHGKRINNTQDGGENEKIVCIVKAHFFTLVLFGFTTNRHSKSWLWVVVHELVSGDKKYLVLFWTPRFFFFSIKFLSSFVNLKWRARDPDYWEAKLNHKLWRQVHHRQQQHPKIIHLVPFRFCPVLFATLTTITTRWRDGPCPNMLTLSSAKVRALERGKRERLETPTTCGFKLLKWDFMIMFLQPWFFFFVLLKSITFDFQCNHFWYSI